MRRLSMKAKKAKAERSDSESVAGSSSAAGSVSPPQDTSDEDSVSRKRNKRPKKAEPPKPKEDDDDRVDVGGDASKRRKRSSLPAKVEDQNENETDEYEVEKVIEVHFKKNGKREFLIRWKGFTQNDDTWEPEENLNCPELIEKFMAKVDKAKSATSRELRVNPQHTDRFTLNSPQRRRRLSRRIESKQRTSYHTYV